MYNVAPKTFFSSFNFEPQYLISIEFGLNERLFMLYMVD